MKVKEIMHKGVEWISPNTSVAALAKKMKKLAPPLPATLDG
jgi:CBS domain-containing protein